VSLTLARLPIVLCKVESKIMNEEYAKHLHETEENYDAIKLWLGFIVFHFVGGAILLPIILFIAWLF